MCTAMSSAVGGEVGALSYFLNQRWVNPQNVTIKERVCCPDIELLSVGFRAFYVPREFPYTVFVNCCLYSTDAIKLFNSDC